MARFILRDHTGDQLFKLEKEAVRVGRSAENDIVIDDPGSSRYHCQLVNDAGGWVLVDLESRNGTLLNGRLHRRRKLEPGDRIEIGNSVVIFEPGEESSDSGRETRDISTRQFSPAVLGEATAERPAAEMDEDEDEDEDECDEAEPVAVAPLSRVLELSKSLCQELDPERLLERIMDAVIDLSGAERGFLILDEQGSEGGKELQIRVARNLDHEAIQRPEMKFSRSIARGVIRHGGSVMTADAASDSRWIRKSSVRDMKLRSVLSVPLRTRERVIGAVYVDNRFKSGLFNQDDRELLEALAGQAAVAIENARLFQETKGQQEELRQVNEEVERLNHYLRDENARQRSELEAVETLVAEHREEVKLVYDYSAIVTRSPKMFTILGLVDKVTDTSAPVIIQGESGTGKELVARALHYNGPRRNEAFVSENCAAIPTSLMESEIFGHVKGAFTGAHRDKKGLLETADGGTLFLDEIGEMNLEVQGKLLRVLQNGEVRRVGAKEWRRVDVRIVSATNRELRQMVSDGQFREDLFYRLNVIGVVLPPLRERREDVPLLVDHFLARMAAKMGGEPRRMQPDVLELFIRHSWPGNIRELENEVHRACTLSEDLIEIDHVSSTLRHSVDDLRDSESGEREGIREERLADRLGDFEDGVLKQKETLKGLVQREVSVVERQAIIEVLRRTRWTKSRSAAILGISRPTLDVKIEKYGLSKEDVLSSSL